MLWSKGCARVEESMPFKKEKFKILSIWTKTDPLNQILLSLGLYWIGELIFDEFLDSDDVLIVAKSDQKPIPMNETLRKISLKCNE